MPSRTLKNRIKSLKNRTNKAVANGVVPIFVNTANNEFVNVINPENDIEVGYYPVPVDEEPPPMKKKIQVVIGAAVVVAGILALIFYK